MYGSIDDCVFKIGDRVFVPYRKYGCRRLSRFEAVVDVVGPQQMYLVRWPMPHGLVLVTGRSTISGWYHIMELCPT
jgi:hypothetical protein